LDNIKCPQSKSYMCSEHGIMIIHRKAFCYTMKFTNMTLVQIPQMNSNLVCKHEYFGSLGFNDKYLKCVFAI